MGFWKKTLCGDPSFLGAVAEFLVGKASSCWCCSFWRGVLYGGIAGAAVGLAF